MGPRTRMQYCAFAIDAAGRLHLRAAAAEPALRRADRRHPRSGNGASTCRSAPSARGGGDYQVRVSARCGSVGQAARRRPAAMISVQRRRLLAAGLALPFAAQSSRWRSPARARSSQTEGPFFKTETPLRSSFLEKDFAHPAGGERPGAVGAVPAGAQRAARVLARRRIRRVRQQRLSLPGAPARRRAGPLPPGDHPAGRVSRARAPYPRQGAGAGPAGAHHASSTFRTSPATGATASTAPSWR